MRRHIGPRRLGLPLLVVALALPSAAPATEVSGGLEVEVGAGFDTNPLELPAEPRGAAFTEVRLDGRVGVDWSPRAGFFLRGGGAARAYGSGLDLADDGFADLETGFRFTPYRSGPRQLSLSVGGRLGLHRDTFVDPATGDVFLWGADPRAAVPIGGRFDQDSAGAFLGLRFRSGRRTLFLLDAEVERRRFVEDYSATTGLEPLDDRTLLLRPGVRLLLGERVVLELAAPLVARRYDALSPLDENGDPVPGELREYRTAGYEVTMQIDPSDLWDVSFGAVGSDRTDRYAGYYDTRGFTAFVSAACFPGDKNAVRLFASRSELDYEAAFVGDPAGGVLRGGEVLRARAAYERRLARRVAWLVEAGALRSDNRDPLYTYAQQWARTGFRLQI